MASSKRGLKDFQNEIDWNVNVHACIPRYSQASNAWTICQILGEKKKTLDGYFHFFRILIPFLLCSLRSTLKRDRTKVQLIKIEVFKYLRSETGVNIIIPNFGDLSQFSAKKLSEQWQFLAKELAICHNFRRKKWRFSCKALLWLTFVH
jgi:hypothetical protein